jgi:hypothetical protein
MSATRGCLERNGSQTVAFLSSMGLYAHMVNALHETAVSRLALAAHWSPWCFRRITALLNVVGRADIFQTGVTIS